MMFRYVTKIQKKSKGKAPPTLRQVGRLAFKNIFHIFARKSIMKATAIQTDIFGTLHPQFITDTAGAGLVVLPKHEFDSIMEEIEDWEDNLLLARAKASDTGERIPMEEVFNRIETARKEA
jgi:hypothetical protein